MKAKFTKEVMYQELSIKISVLEMKIDKILELLNQPEGYIHNPDFVEGELSGNQDLVNSPYFDYK